MKSGTVSLMDEIQYRLDCLTMKKDGLNDKTVVLYGTGKNAERVLNCLNDVKIVGLMDSARTGSYILGKKVLSDEEVLLLGVNLIIIATEPDYADIVMDRIQSFCIYNRIDVWDMYGNDLMECRRQILLNSLNYHSVTYESVRNNIKSKSVVFFSLGNSLLTRKLSMDNLIACVGKKLGESGYDYSEFVEERMRVREELSPDAGCNIDDLYFMLSSYVSDSGLLATAKEIEKEIVVNNLRINERILAVIREVLNDGKEIFVCSKLFEGGDVVKEYLDSIGLSGVKIIYSDERNYTNTVMRYLHTEVDRLGSDNVLYVCADERETRIPLTYNVSYCSLKSSLSMYEEYYQKMFPIKLDSDEKYDAVSEAISSPFIDELNEVEIASKLKEYLNEEEKPEKYADIRILPLIDTTDVGKIEKLVLDSWDDPMVTIIIQAQDRFEYTYNCLRSIIHNSKACKYEVILIDNMSTDLTTHIEDIVEGIKVIHNNETLPMAKNYNMASKYARGRYITFLGNDTQVQPRWLKALIKTFDNNPECGLVGSKLVFPDGTLKEAGGIVWNDADCCRYGEGDCSDSPEYNYVRETDYISDISLMITKSLWDEIGGFNERYYSEYIKDLDIAFEARKRGRKVFYQPKSVVVSYDGYENDKELREDAEKYLLHDRKCFSENWREELLLNQKPNGTNVLAACDRKINKKTVLFISVTIPTYDKDAGSRVIDFYIREFISKGYIVKYLPDSFEAPEPYATRYQQMGVEILAGGFYKNHILRWLCDNRDDIDFAFLNYPDCSIKYIDRLKELNIPVRYFGHDLHYLRMKREYEVLGVERYLQLSKEYYETEKYLIGKSDVVYYPSDIEVNIVKEEFNKRNVRQINLNIYDKDYIKNNYLPSERRGIMFIGGYNHSPNVDAVNWFVNWIYPNIYSELEIPFFIAGSNMPSEISSIDVEGIEVVGRLSDYQLDEMYKKVKLIVIPLRYGAGVKGKVIEAMAHGIPVISTSIGMEGIPRIKSYDIIADDECTFSTKVCQIYNDDKILKEISLEETQIIIDNYSREAAWNKISMDF